MLSDMWSQQALCLNHTDCFSQENQRTYVWDYITAVSVILLAPFPLSLQGSLLSLVIHKVIEIDPILIIQCWL